MLNIQTKQLKGSKGEILLQHGLTLRNGVIVTVQCNSCLTLVFLPSSHHPSLPLSSLTVSQVCVCSLSPAVTPSPVFLLPPSSPLSCSSGIFPWANRKLQRLVMRPPRSSPANCVPVNRRQYFPFPKHSLPPTRILHLLLTLFWRLLVTNLHTISCLILSVHPLLMSVTPWLGLEEKCLLTLV